MDNEFLGKGMLALTPITLGAVVFCLLSLSHYGYPIATYDMVLTHYQASLDTYSPLLPAINIAARWALNLDDYLYAFWWILLAISICFIFPYILLYEITKKHRYGVAFIYGSAVPVITFITGTIPQALIVCFMLLLIARPKWFWAVLILAGLTHVFGVFAILGTRLWMWYKARDEAYTAKYLENLKRIA